MRDVPTAVRQGTSIGPFAELAAALAFLTRLPLPRRALLDDRTGAAGFGLVGALLGAAGAVPLVLLGGAHPVLAGVGAIGILAALDGGLHLDGLGDTFDALAAPPGAAERARTDPRAGAAGVIAIIVVVGIDVAALGELLARGSAIAVAGMVAAACMSRAWAPASAVLLGRATSRVRGLGGWFTEAVAAPAALVSVVTALVVTAVAAEFAGLAVALGAVAGLVAGSAALAAIVGMRGQLDGDGYGAGIELMFAAIVGATALLL